MKKIPVRYEVRGKEYSIEVPAKEVPHDEYGLWGFITSRIPTDNAGSFFRHPKEEEVIDRLHEINPEPTRYGWFV